MDDNDDAAVARDEMRNSVRDSMRPLKWLAAFWMIWKSRGDVERTVMILTIQ